MGSTLLLILFYLLLPAGVIWACRKISFLNKIGPILLLYILGVIAGNLPIMPESAHEIQDLLSSAIIPIAIPMMLFNSNFRKFSFKKSALTLLSGVIAVIITVVLGFVIFKGKLGPEGYKVGGMLTGVYTGGTPNLAALKLMLGVKDETYILLNSYDMIVSFLYLVFLMSVGIKLFRRILPAHKSDNAATDSIEGTPQAEEDAYVGIFKWTNSKQVLISFCLSILILIISAGLAVWASGGLSQGLGAAISGKSFMVVLILSLTTLGIAASFIPFVQRQTKSYDGGMYLVYIFSLVVASMADLSNLNFEGGIYMLLYIIFVIFLSLFIQLGLSKLLKIDADTMIISSVALVNSPPLVPMMAAAMKNKDVIITGLSVGIIGYAVGNYLGFLISELLQLF